MSPERAVVVIDQRVEQIDRRRLDPELGVSRCRSAARCLRAIAVSSNAASPSKPMLNVRTGSRINWLMTPTMIVESMPPLRNAPSGTSLISRRSTAAVTSSRTRAAVRRRDRGGSGSRSTSGNVSCQYLRGADVPSRSITSTRAGLDVANAPVERVRMRHVAVQEVVAAPRRSSISTCGVRMGQERLDLRREQRCGRHPGREQRLLAGAIARQHQPSAPLIPDGQREHAVEPSIARSPCSS